MKPRDTIDQLIKVMMDGGEKAFDIVPLYLGDVINGQLWRERADKDGHPFQSFEAFVNHRLWQGLESNIDDLRIYCRKHPEIRKLIDAEVEAIAAHGEIGRNHLRGSNTTSDGRGSTYTLKRLKRDRPDLAEKVINGELSANAAAIEAGFRKKQIRKCPKCGHQW